MADKKRQHYVPRFYLKYFSNNYMAYFYNVAKEENIGNFSCKSQCYENYFYGKDDILENTLSLCETKWSVAFKATLEDDYSYIDDLREFVIIQYLRTKAFNERTKDMICQQLVEILKYNFSYNGMVVDNEYLKENVDLKVDEFINPNSNLDMVNGLKDLIEDLSFLKIHYETNKKLISSDNPIILLNPYLPPHAGLGALGLIIIFPLSPTDLAIFYDKKIYTKNNTYKIISTNQSEINHLNALTYANADEIIYSLHPFDKITISEENRRLRDYNQNKSIIQTIGNENDKLIVFHQHTIYHDFNFSFAKIDKAFSIINYDFRDNVPRKYDKDFEKKLYNRFQNWFVNIALMNSNADIEKYKKGYKDYYYLIKKYWEQD